MNFGIIITDITHRAGTERAVSNLANILNDQNHKVFIISVESTSGNSPYKLNDNISIIHTELNTTSKNIIKKISNYILLNKKLKRICSEKKLDFLITTLAIYTPVINSIKNIKKIACEHFNYESAGKLHNIIKHIFYPQMDAVVILTERDRKNYKFLTNIDVIQNSLPYETEHFSDCLNKEIISVGRLTKQKGFDLLIQAVNLIKNELNGWHFTIYGEGEDKEKLESMIYTFDLSKYISIHHNVTDIQTIYLNSSIYVSSSRWEGFSMVLLESQSFGVPGVAFDCPNGPDEMIINNETGYIVKSFDFKELANKILLLIKDEEKRIAFGKEAKKQSERFSTKTISTKWKKLVDSLIVEQ